MMSSDNRNREEGRQGDRGGRQGGRRYVRPRKSCRLCQDKIYYVDWKDSKFLQNFIPERGKILPRRISGTCARCQQMIAEAIKRARNAALLPFTTD